ncbi:hypothetical protein [Planococcus donghaensis]
MDSSQTHLATDLAKIAVDVGTAHCAGASNVRALGYFVYFCRWSAVSV